MNAFVDAWHDDAANARWAYFDKIAPDGVYIGTDRTELWHKDAFKAWAKPYFERKKALGLQGDPAQRLHVRPMARPSGSTSCSIPQMGPCMASGVLRRTAGGFEIEHYQLSMAVPNELAKTVTQLIGQGAPK